MNSDVNDVYILGLLDALNGKHGPWFLLDPDIYYMQGYWDVRRLQEYLSRENYQIWKEENRGSQVQEAS